MTIWEFLDHNATGLAFLIAFCDGPHTYGAAAKRARATLWVEE